MSHHKHHQEKQPNVLVRWRTSSGEFEEIMPLKTAHELMRDADVQILSMEDDVRRAKRLTTNFYPDAPDLDESVFGGFKAW